MPSVSHEETMRVRYYECDAFGRLDSVNVVRWFQEIAFRASSAVGYDGAKYAELGSLWLIRETEADYLEPLVYGDAVRVKTWVGEFRRTHSLRFYELTNERTGRVAVRAITDWAFVDQSTLRPTPVTGDMLDTFWPGGSPPPAQPRKRLPRSAYRRPTADQWRVPVEWHDIDPMWHVNNAVYARYIEDATVHVAASRGWSIPRMLQNGRSLSIRKHRIEYRIPAQLSDELIVKTWVPGDDEGAAQADGNLAGDWLYEIRRSNDQTLLARASSRWKWQDVSADEATGGQHVYGAAAAARLATGDHESSGDELQNQDEAS